MMDWNYFWMLLGTLIYPLLFAIHLTLALLAGVHHFPQRRRWQRVTIHVLTGLGFAGIGLSTSTLYPVLSRDLMGPVVRVLWVALVAVWAIVFVQNIQLELQRRRDAKAAAGP